MYSATLEEASWNEINNIAQANKAQQLWSVGDTKNIVVSGETITMQIIGFNHDTLTSGGAAKITFGMKDLMANTRQFNRDDEAVGGYSTSQIHSYVDNTVYNSFPSDLRSVIKPVNKKVNSGYPNWDVSTVAMNVFLFSMCEIYTVGTGNAHWSVRGDGSGSRYAHFSSNSTRIKRLANGSGNANTWWTMTPMISTVDAWRCEISDMGSDGTSSGSGEAQNTRNGVCFGFCV